MAASFYAPGAFKSAGHLEWLEEYEELPDADAASSGRRTNGSATASPGEPVARGCGANGYPAAVQRGAEALPASSASSALAPDGARSAAPASLSTSAANGSLLASAHERSAVPASSSASAANGSLAASAHNSSAAVALPAEPPSRGQASAPASSFSSFYPRSGGICSTAPTVPQLPWTRRDSPYADFQGDAGERRDSRERRHRSSWHAALNKRIVSIERAEDLLAMVNRELNGFDVLNTVTALNRLSRLEGSRRYQRDPRALEVLYRLEAWLARASGPGADRDGPEAVLPKHLASISTGLARLQWKNSTAGRVLRMLVSLAPTVLDNSRPRDLSNLAWAFATLEMRSFESALLAIAREAVVQIADFNEQNLSNICWAFAKLGLRHDPLIKAIADETLKKMPQFSAQGLTNTLWGYATLVIKGEECLGKSAWKLVCALLEELQKRLPECPTQQLSNSAWACCRLGVRHEGFMAAIAEEGMRKVHDYTPQDLANTSMAFAKPNIQNRRFLEALAKYAAQKIDRFEAREVSNMTWSLNIMGPGLIGPEWIDHALDHFSRLVKSAPAHENLRRDGDFEGWEMVQVINACWSHRAALRHWPGLARSFRERIFLPVVKALATIVGRGPLCPNRVAATCAAAAAAAAAVQGESGEEVKLLSAGPKSHGALAAAARPPPQLEPLTAARQEAQDIIEKLQVDFLGPVFTRCALRELGFVDKGDIRSMDAFDAGADAGSAAAAAEVLEQRERDAEAQAPAWGRRARAAVADALREMRETMPFMWFDRFGPHERRVQCWISYELEVKVNNGFQAPLCETLREPGRIVNFSLDEHRAMCQHGCETFARLEAETHGEVLFTLEDIRKAQKWLQGLFAQHDRAGHCERQALLEVTIAVITAVRRLQRETSGEAFLRAERCISEGFFDGAEGVVVSGTLQMFVCHFFCISCVAALSNFARRFPEVALQTDYDDCWRTRLLDV
eukprot:TRINITY_DN5544_c0_g1_i1.p1 TRINITY_DN5544_c0_g1~~TRINITY_DN5544_c0_g1_i1.p1  ORF type:complete len:967 (-),score=226.17 TRINITY_DN5544_c0_g1_i1:232-3132(-)